MHCCYSRNKVRWWNVSLKNDGPQGRRGVTRYPGSFYDGTISAILNVKYSSWEQLNSASIIWEIIKPDIITSDSAEKKLVPNSSGPQDTAKFLP